MRSLIKLENSEFNIIFLSGN